MKYQKKVASFEECINQTRSRTVRNVHGSAKKACEIWLSKKLSGDPLITGNKYQVWGINRRHWSQVHVIFTDKHITVTIEPEVVQ